MAPGNRPGADGGGETVTEAEWKMGDAMVRRFFVGTRLSGFHCSMTKPDDAYVSLSFRREPERLRGS
jgi:hypothetical protein